MRLRDASIGLALACALLVVLGCEPNEAVVCDAKDKAVGAGCEATYGLCNGSTYVLRCDPKGDLVECACIENGRTARTFTSDDACKVTPDTRRKRAADGCTWTLE